MTGTTAALSVLGADDAGESTLTYTWATTGTPPAPRSTFSANGSNAAKNTTATFSEAGNYSLPGHDHRRRRADGHQQRQRDGQPDADGIAVTPAMPTLASHAQQQFTATAEDQFGAALGLHGDAPGRPPRARSAQRAADRPGRLRRRRR